jgi:GT2 family glycosyltransferase
VRRHHVTALVVAYQGSAWLPRTLAGLAAQDHPVDAAVAVDAGSTDDTGRLLRSSIRTVVTLKPDPANHARRGRHGDPGLPLALAAARAAAHSAVTVPAGAGGPPPVRWYWILHDDSAPDPDALAQLLAGADRNLSAAVLVPKTVAWSDRNRLVGIGNRWAPGNPVVERLEPRERDQGQYDVDRPVYTGDSAGMLVRAEAWDEQGGFDAELGAWGAPTGLCRRVWGSGASVMFIPQAVLAHRRAGHSGARDQPATASTPRRRDWEAMLLLELSRGPAWTLPGRFLRAWLATFLRALALLVTHERAQARAKIQGCWDVLGHPGRVLAVRRTLADAALPESTRPSHVRSNRGTVTHNMLDDLLAGQRARRTSAGGWRPARRLVRPAVAFLVLATLSLLRSSEVLFGAGTLRGGGLLPAPSSPDLLGAYLASWHDVGLGTGAPLPPYLGILAVAGLPAFGSVDLVLRLAFGLAVPFAFLSAYLSAGPTLLGPWRLVVSLTWALLPAGAAATGDGRISTLAVLLLGPPAARAFVRALTCARAGLPVRRDVVVASALMGLLAAFAPLAFLLSALGCLIAWPLARCPLWALRGGGTPLAAGAAFLALWAPRLLASPWLLLADLGRTDQSLAEPGAAVLGLSPGGPAGLWWPGVPLLVVTLATAVWNVRSWGPLSAALGACVALAAIAWLPSLAARTWSAEVAGRVWSGQSLLLASALLLGALATLVNRPGRGSDFGGTGLLVALGVLVVGWWVTPVHMATSQATGEPPVVTLSAESPDRPRAIVLSRSADQLTYGVSTSSPARLGDADALADVLDGQGLTPVVQGLVSGAGVDVTTELGGRAVRYVVFDGGPEDPLVAALDATSGLRRLATSAQQSLWLVSGEPSRAELGPANPAASAERGPGEDPTASGRAPVQVPVETVPTSVHVVLHPLIELPRILGVAEQYDRGWEVTLHGRPLLTQPDARGMLTAPVSQSGELVVAHHSSWTWWARLHLAAIVGLLLVALPWRRRPEPRGEPLG